MFSWIAKKNLLFALFFLFFASSAAFGEVSWKPLLPGLQQASWSGKDTTGHTYSLELFKIDTKQYKLQLVQASDYQLSKISAKEMVLKTGALLGINGGFFDPQYKPLGLLVKDGNVVNPSKPISWWGVFSYDKNSGASVDKSGEFQAKPTTEVAIQVGPRLIDENRIMPLKKNDSLKTFVGIASDHQVILGVTEMSSVDANDLAQMLWKELRLREVLNFDGGGSTQLYAKLGKYEKDLPGITSVANGLVIVRRK